MMNYGMGWGFGWIAMILVWIVPVVLLVAAIKYLFLSDRGANSESRASGSHALALLEERYAKGDLTREEFLQKRDDILG